MNRPPDLWPSVPPPAARGAAFAAGALGLGILLAAGLFRPALFFRSYLIGYLAWLALPLGCLALTMLHHLTGGAWGDAIRRPLRAAAATVPLFALLFLPLLVGLGELYPWARPQEVAHDPVLQAKRLYLNVPFFLVRALLYLAVWVTLAFLLERWSRWQEDTPEAEPPRRFRLLSAPGLAVSGLTVTFAAIDWAMSLEPHWFSSIYGVIFANGMLLAGMAFAILAALWLGEPVAGPGEFPAAVRRDLGSLLLAFVMLWTYLGFSQYLLIWSANLPEEVVWYLRRLENGWQFAALALIIFQFAVPFFLLLSPRGKRNVRTLAWVAALVLAMRFVDLEWIVAPAFPGGPERLLDLAGIVGVGGVWLGVVLGRLRSASRAPVAEPARVEEPSHAS